MRLLVCQGRDGMPVLGDSVGSFLRLVFVPMGHLVTTSIPLCHTACSACVRFSLCVVYVESQQWLAQCSLDTISRAALVTQCVYFRSIEGRYRRSVVRFVSLCVA